MAMALWYADHLGMRVVRLGDAPGHARFLADDKDATVLETYAGALPVPDYGAMDPALIHVAFATDYVEATRARLIAAGAVPVGEVVTTPGGDAFAMLRDPRASRSSSPGAPVPSSDGPIPSGPSPG